MKPLPLRSSRRIDERVGVRVGRRRLVDEIEAKGVEEERKVSAAVPRAEISEGVRMCVQLSG
jgi:hypothetical protein